MSDDFYFNKSKVPNQNKTNKKHRELVPVGIRWTLAMRSGIRQIFSRASALGYRCWFTDSYAYFSQ